MAEVWKPEPEVLEGLDGAVPEILASQKENGQFGTEPWVCGDQSVIFSLAAAWRLKDSKYHRNDEVLEAIVRGGDALIHEQDAEGKWTFLKKDYSEWGQIYMPWTYSRWIRAYQMVQEAMDAGARARWDEALLMGFDGISRTCLAHVHNIPAHHSMALFCAGTVFGREDWRAQSRAFLGKVADAQSSQGWWPEHNGPVVAYNFVYSDSLGIYYGMSGDAEVLPALERAAVYHASLTYPDGSPVETVDGRNPYHGGVHEGNPGFSHTAAGRGYLAQQHRLLLAEGESFDPDYAASLLLYGGSGEAIETAAGQERHVYRMGDEATAVRNGPWFLCLSAFVVDFTQNRWGQDRQNFVSVFHDRVGLVVGGGNTKLQPLWSCFTVGDKRLLSHTPGDEDPDFDAPEGLIHVPDEISYDSGEDGGRLRMRYGEETCGLEVKVESEAELALVFSATGNSGMPVAGHVTLMPHLDREVSFASGDTVMLGEEKAEWTGKAWLQHAGWRLHLPRDSRVVWPALPHNPYRKAGDSTIEEARLVVVLPFSPDVGRHELKLEVL
jgi:hypothetical protein